MYELISLWESNGAGEIESAELAKSQLSGDYLVFMFRKGRRNATDRAQFASQGEAVNHLRTNHLVKMMVSPYNDKSPF